MINIKKSKVLDLRRFGKNTYQEDIQDAGTKGYNEGYQEGYETGYEEGGGGSSTECGLADALTTVYAWDYQDHGSGSATYEKPDAFLVFEQYATEENGIDYLKTITKNDSEYYVPEYASGASSSNMGDVRIYSFEQMNDFSIIGNGIEGTLYNVNSTTDWNTLIYPLYEVKQRGYWFSLEGLRISYVKICQDGRIISSADEGVGSEILDHDVVKKQILVEPDSIFNNEEDLIFDILIPS